MRKEKSIKLFDRLSPFFGRAYGRQRKQYSRIFQSMVQCNLSHFSTILDVGFGSGAMASVFADMRLKTYAVDRSMGMLKVAKQKLVHNKVNLVLADAVDGLPFPENSFDVVIAAFVAHGMQAEERLKLYAEMKRVGKHLFILHDYNGKRSLIYSLAEFLEGGDFFNFTRVIKDELMDYFGNLEIVNTDKMSCCYVCNIS